MTQQNNESNPDKLSKDEHDIIYENVIRENYIVAVDLERQEHPKAIILAGQPGAGKSFSLCHDAMEEMKERGGAVKIDTDELREYHKYPQYLAEPGRDREAANRMHEDASLWSKELRDDAIKERYNLILDNTLGDPDKAEKLCGDLRKNGYEIDIRALAVKKEVSRLGCLARFEEGKAEYDKQKAVWGDEIVYRKDAYFYRHVPNEVHDKACNGLPESLERIEKNGLADTITVANRTELLYSTTLNHEYMPDNNARTVLESERSRELTVSEKKDCQQKFDFVEGQMQKRGEISNETSQELTHLAESLGLSNEDMKMNTSIKFGMK